MKTIVALVSFSDVSFKVLKYSHTLAKAFGSSVILLHVVPKEASVMGIGIASPTILQDPSPEHVQEDEAKLGELRDTLAKYGVSATSAQFKSASVDELLAECRRLAADLIVIGSHAHGALYNLFVGSVTDSVLKKSFCPVLVVPEDAAAAKHES